MYMTKEKKGMSLYRNYTPRFSKHQEIEVQAYVASAISDDLSNRMQSTVRGLSAMIVHGFSKKGR